MIRFIWTLIFVILASLFVLWLGHSPGSLKITWLGYTVTMSIQVAFWCFLALIGVVSLAVWAALTLWDAPWRLWDFLRMRRLRLGHAALERAVLAHTSGDPALAQKEIRSCLAWMGQTNPIAQAIEADILANTSHSSPLKTQTYDHLLKNTKLEMVGLYGFYRDFSSKKDRLRALDMATRALRRSPLLPWANAALLADRALHADWDVAEGLLTSQMKLGLLEETSYQKKKAVVYTARALRDEKTDSKAALSSALEAHRLDPGLVPAACVLSRLYLDMGAFGKAQKSLEKTWSLSPHGALADLYARCGKENSPQKSLERLSSLNTLSPGGEEGAVALARCALEAKRPEEARQALLPYASDSTCSMRVCWLMMAVCLTLRLAEEALMWLMRAAHGRPDPLWISGTMASHTWHPVCQETGEIGAFSWAPPFMLQTSPSTGWSYDLSTSFLREGLPLLKELSQPQKSSCEPSRDPAVPSLPMQNPPFHQPDDPGTGGK